MSDAEREALKRSAREYLDESWRRAEQGLPPIVRIDPRLVPAKKKAVDDGPVGTPPPVED